MAEKTPTNPLGAGRTRLDDPEAIKRSLISKYLKIANDSDVAARDRLAAGKELRELMGLAGFSTDDTHVPKDDSEMEDVMVRILTAAGRPLSERAFARAFTSCDTISTEAERAESAQDVAEATPGGGHLD